MQTMGSSYPVIIDDIKGTCFKGKNATLEGFVKSYWEENWTHNSNYPVMILNTNHEELEIWAKTRIRRLEFNVKFHGGAKDTMLLNDLFNSPNHVFPAFAQEYYSQLLMGVEYDTDQLNLARETMIDLYRIVGRKLPDFFPVKPPEEIFDMDAISCYNKRKFRLFTEKRVRGALRLQFSNWKSRDSFKARLPPKVVFTEDDKVLIIENPKVYREFMNKGKPVSKRFFNKRKLLKS